MRKDFYVEQSVAGRRPLRAPEQGVVAVFPLWS